MSIISPGIGSGLDINGIITKLMSIEQQPLTKLDTQEASYQTKISAFGSLQGAISSLDSALAGLVTSYGQTASEKFATLSASVADSTIASVSTSSGAVTGSYSLEVTQLATAHRLTTFGSVAQKIATASTYTSTDVINGTGLPQTLKIRVGDGAVKEITIPDGTQFSQLETLINDADAGVTAQIVGTPGTLSLELTSDTPGVNSTITLSDLAGFEYDGTLPNDLTQVIAPKGYASSSDTIATGTLSVLVGSGAATEITIDSTNNTLSGLRDAINDANLGLTATIVTVSATDARLVLTSKQAGTANEITLSGLSGFANADLSEAEADGGQAAQNAGFKLNGVAMTSETNTVTAVSGLTLTLLKESASGVSTTVSVTQNNSSALNTALSALVTAYNDFNKTVKNLGSYDPKTKKAGPLLGNSTLRQVESVVRSNLGNPVSGLSGVYKYISDIGLEVQRDGSVSLNTSKLQTAITSNYSATADLVAAFGERLHNATRAMLDTDNGTIDSALDAINKSIDNIGEKRESLKLRLKQIQANYVAQFTAMDKFVASWNQTSSYMTQQLTALTNASK